MALLSVRGLSKRFATVQALADIDLDFAAGEIHAVLGENGAGKSTLMQVLAGTVAADSGRVLLDGKPVALTSPRAARAAGIGMVHQHFTLVDALTVVENLALGLPSAARWRFDRTQAATEAQALAARLGLELSPPDEPVGNLPVGARQRLEILKALAGASRVLILDEPTAVLTPPEVRQLFAILREVRAQNRLVIFITHKLREVTAIADRVTILRRGRVVTTVSAHRMSEGQMAEAMMGEVVTLPPRPAPGAGRIAAALQVSELSAVSQRGARVLDGVSFTVPGGMIFGIAGVDGNGQQELFEVLLGLRTPSAGTVSIAGQRLTRFTPVEALAAGVGHIPPDRHADVLALSLTLTENLLLSRGIVARFACWGTLRWDRARRFAAALVQQYAIRCTTLEAPVQELSGGNQQRIIVARALAQQPRVLVAVNPTRGLDIHAAAAVGEALAAAAQRGCAVVLISTDLDEVLELSHCVSVLFRGRLSTPLQPPADPERLGLLMAGVDAPPAAPRV